MYEVCRICVVMYSMFMLLTFAVYMCWIRSMMTLKTKRSKQKKKTVAWSKQDKMNVYTTRNKLLKQSTTQFNELKVAMTVCAFLLEIKAQHYCVIDCI